MIDRPKKFFTNEKERRGARVSARMSDRAGPAMRMKKLLSYFRRYWITPTSIWLRQRDGWVELRRDEIAALKFETVSRIIVRFYGGQRVIVSLYRFPNGSYSAVYPALRDTLPKNQETRGLWAGAEVLKHYD
jgi:hypothetical protein